MERVWQHSGREEATKKDVARFKLSLKKKPIESRNYCVCVVLFAWMLCAHL